jgi:glycosyltransferase involved in cell wall biosynthesis
MPTFSIITVNLNNRPGLEKTIESVISQTFKDFEYIIVDGGSTDGSRELLERYAANLTYSTSEKDEGIYHAMNKGISKATGDFLMFLNSGDYLLKPNVLSLSSEFINTQPADIYYGNILIEKSDLIRYSKKHEKLLTLDYLEKGTINHQASFICRRLFKELGGYDVRFAMAADHAFYLKAFLNGKEFQYFDLVMVNYEVNGMSMIHWDKYSEEMKVIFDAYVPPFLKRIVLENRAYKHLLRHGIMKVAKKINDSYQGIKRSF